MASLNQNILEQIDFPFMEREYQDKITGSLEIIDEKIKVNQKINENLAA
jgi:restriction endonuclease S subunit